MKKAFVALAVLIQIVFASSASADEASKSESLKKDRLWYLAGLSLYAASVGIIIHEGSHAFAVWVDSDFELINFRPYPHIEDGRGFVAGSVELRCNELDDANNCADKTGLGVIASSPYITDLTLFVASDILLSTGAVNPDSKAGLALYLVGMVYGLYDFSRNLIWAVEGSDPDQIARNFEIPRWSVVASASAVSAVGLWRLWVNGRRVFFDADHSSKESKLTIAPMSGPESFGMTLSVHF
ncbi:MAG: hypothetical protein AAB606_02175 [Patescibacteria group bacterium]